VFTTIIVQPIFNLLVLIYALLPGHNFGLAIIIFTVIIRLLMWPLVKSQITQAKAMRELAPEIKKIKAAAKGDRAKESKLTMELYREKEINPFASIGVLIIQIPILFGLYAGLRRIIKDPHSLLTFSYSWLHHLSWMKHLATNIHAFDNTLFGVVNLSRTAVETGGIYWAAMVIIILSALAQFFQARQLMPQPKDARSLKSILSEANKGQKADQAEVNAAVTKGTQYFIPFMVFFISLRLAASLPLYWLSSSAVAYVQQSRLLREDTAEADANVPEQKPKIKKPQPKKQHQGRRRRH